MIKFGPAGASDDFRAEGHKETLEMPAFLKAKGLDTFEYPCGRGVRISADTATKIGEAFKAEDIEISVHAPYFINFATEDDLKAQNNHRYIKDALNAVRLFGGTRIVFHPGSPLKRERSYAMDILERRINVLMEELHTEGYEGTYICAETMGKIAQLGNLDEVIRIVNLDDMILPCVDFGHLNARTLGSLRTKADYREVIDRLIEGVGYDKTSRMHIHFSKIMYSKGGEVKHLTFEDEVYGPEPEPLMEVLSDYKIDARVISESAGTQSRDAKLMKDYYWSYNAKNNG